MRADSAPRRPGDHSIWCIANGVKQGAMLVSGRNFGRVVEEGSNCRVPLASDEVGIPAYGGQAQRSRHRFVGLSAGGGFKSHPRHQLPIRKRRMLRTAPHHERGLSGSIANMRLAEHKRGHLLCRVLLKCRCGMGVGIEGVGDGGVPGCYSSPFPATIAALELDV